MFKLIKCLPKVLCLNTMPHIIILLFANRFNPFYISASKVMRTIKFALAYPRHFVSLYGFEFIIMDGHIFVITHCLESENLKISLSFFFHIKISIVCIIVIDGIPPASLLIVFVCIWWTKHRMECFKTFSFFFNFIGNTFVLIPTTVYLLN